MNVRRMRKFLQPAGTSRQVLAILLAASVALIGFGPPGSASAGEAGLLADPIFFIFPEWKLVESLYWPDGALVTASVAGKPACVAEGVSSIPAWSPGIPFVGLRFSQDCTLAVGDVVALTDGVTTRTHTIRLLNVAGVDPAADTVTGTAAPGETVFVWEHWSMTVPLQVTASADGTWLANFSTIPHDIAPRSIGRAEVRDAEGNSTAQDWYVPDPRFTVFPEWNWIEGIDWPAGSMVSASVTGKPQCAGQGTTSQDPGPRSHTFVGIAFPGTCTLAAGDVVVLTSGSLTAQHAIFSLSIGEVNWLEDTISGTASPGQVVKVWVHGEGFEQQATAAGDGSWQVDFSGVFDLRPGYSGRVVVEDVSGNATGADWSIALKIYLPLVNRGQ